MTADEYYQEFRRRKHQRPFEPFEVEIVGGRRFVAPHVLSFAATPRMVVLQDADARNHFVKYPEILAIHSLVKTE